MHSIKVGEFANVGTGPEALGLCTFPLLFHGQLRNQRGEALGTNHLIDCVPCDRDDQRRNRDNPVCAARRKNPGV